MSNQKHRSMKELVLMTAILGVGFAGTVTAEPPHPMKGDTQARQGSHYRNQDITGGFYDDRYKRDNWYYDFYDSPGATRTSSSTLQSKQHADLIDAAHPRVTGRSSASSQSMAYQQYYDEPWFYNRRDPSYGMPVAHTGDPMVQPAGGQDNVVKGTVNAVKQVRNRTTGEQNTVALIKTADNRSVISDLGPTQSTLDMALSKGDNIQVGGQWEDVGDYSVLMAQQVKSGANRVWLNRGGSAASSDNRRVEGRIKEFRDIRVKRTGELHRAAAIQTADGRYSIVDLGPAASEPSTASASAGDRLVADGRVIDVGNYPVLLANQVSINGGAPVRIARPAGTMDSAPGNGSTDRSCLGGGCSGGQATTSDGQPRDPHTNAMDGTIR